MSGIKCALLMSAVRSSDPYSASTINKYADDIKTVKPYKTPCHSSITEDPQDNDPEFSKEKYE